MGVRKLYAGFARAKYSQVIGRAKTIVLRSDPLNPMNFESTSSNRHLLCFYLPLSIETLAIGTLALLKLELLKFIALGNPAVLIGCSEQQLTLD